MPAGVVLHEGHALALDGFAADELRLAGIVRQAERRGDGVDIVPVHGDGVKAEGGKLRADVAEGHDVVVPAVYLKAVMVENNGEIIRLGIPQPTEERRKELVKQCNKIGERSKVEIRNARQDTKDKLKKAIKDGLSEDLEKDAEGELQKVHDKFVKKVDDLLTAKQKEIMTV